MYNKGLCKKLKSLNISITKLYEQQSLNDKLTSQKYEIGDYHNSATDGSAKFKNQAKLAP